jgi:hypothetical protein
MVSNVEHMLEDFFTAVFMKAAAVADLCLQAFE